MCGTSRRDISTAAYAPRLDVIRAALPQILHDDRQQADIAAYDALDELEAALSKIATPKRPDGTYNLSREACEEIAREALRRGDT